jgi:RNA polymerase sigma factor (sigma-70 family)
MIKKQKIVMSENNLIDAIRMKSSAGAAALYDMYSKTLYGVIVNIVCNKEMSEDVCQETFIRIWNSFDKYDAAKGRLFTWMSCIARNIAKDALRSRQYSQYNNTITIENLAERIEQEHLVIFDTDKIGIKLWTEHLNKNQKDILDLIYFKGYTHAEVANELDMPLGTVKSRCRIGLLKLRGIYNE